MKKRTVVIGDGTWVHYFELAWKVSNKIWATKKQQKTSTHVKKVLYVIFFSGEGVTIHMPVEKGTIITGKYNKDVV